MKKRSLLHASFAALTFSFSSLQAQNNKPIRLVTLDPGHFHAALVQKTMYREVDPVVHVYAPAGSDLQFHLDRISAYNNRKENPTTWKEEVYTGPDFLEKMLAQKKGNVVVLSGNNQKKAEYILRSLQAGFHVFADKPMAINSQGFEQLKQAFAVAKKNKRLLYDIMTERFEITTILLRELSMSPDIFGSLQKGTAADPALVKESTHFFDKFVSGNVLTRPEWFFDVSQQGAGIVDVMTHLVDLAQWESFPGQAIDYKKDIRIDGARRWTTPLTKSQFTTLTKASIFPSYLKNAIANDTLLNIYSNGEIRYTLRGVHVKTSVVWNYQAPEGTGDTYQAVMKGTKAVLRIRQGAEQGYKPVLYIEPVGKNAAYETMLNERFKTIQAKYPGVGLKSSGNGWEVFVPEKYKENHEEHFGRVMQNFLHYLQAKDMPAWEVPNMLAKYYTTTKALDLAQRHQP